MQDNVIVSPLDALISAGVFTEMEETRERPGDEMKSRKLSIMSTVKRES